MSAKAKIACTIYRKEQFICVTARIWYRALLKPYSARTFRHDLIRGAAIIVVIINKIIAGKSRNAIVGWEINYSSP